MTKFGSGLIRKFPVGLMILCLTLLTMSPVAQAAYEVNKSTIKPDLPTDVPSQWKDKNFNVEFDAVAMTGTDIFIRYIYKWSNTSTLSSAEFNATTNDGEAILAGTTYVVSRPASDLAAMDYGDTLYLHLKTEYFSAGVPTLSEDVNGDVVDDVNGGFICSGYGPFLIDNTAPAGTIWLVDGSGNTITSTSSTDLLVKAAASIDPKKVYFSETSVRPTGSLSYSSGNLPFSLTDLSLGPKTLYAWFEDAVGNVSSAPATVDFDLLSVLSISPYDPTIDLLVGTQQFQVGDGSTAYKWNIIDQVQDPSGTDVATFADGTTEILSAQVVTVNAKNKGTFKLTATAADTTVLTSGIISFIQTTRTNSITLTTGWNWVSFNVLPAAEARAYSVFFGSNAALVEQVKTQTAAVLHIGTAWNGDQTLMNKIAQGAMFKIKVSQGFTLDVTGLPIDPTTPITLNNGWTWAAYLPDAVLNWDVAVAGVMDKLQQLKSQTQARVKVLSSFNGTLNTMAPGKGYVIQTNAAGTLNYPAP